MRGGGSGKYLIMKIRLLKFKFRPPLSIYYVSNGVCKLKAKL